MATKQETKVEAQGFLAQLQTLATPINDLSVVAVKKDPLLNAKAKFAANCDEMCKLIRSAAESGKWFKKLPDGKYLVTFRNGNSAMKLAGTAHFQTPDAAAAVRLIEAAKEAANKGELDAALKESSRAPRGSKKQAQS